jgi:hypothetical protein
MSTLHILSPVTKRKGRAPGKQQDQDLILTAAEARLIRAYRNTDDETQEMAVRTVERYALNPELMRHKAPVFQLVAGGRGA